MSTLSTMNLHRQKVMISILLLVLFAATPSLYRLWGPNGFIHSGIVTTISKQAVLVQSAAEAYAIANHGRYPEDIDGLKRCLPIHDIKNSVASSKDWLTVKVALDQQHAVDEAHRADRGQIIYLVLKTGQGSNGYMVFALDENGKAISRFADGSLLRSRNLPESYLVF